MRYVVMLFLIGSVHAESVCPVSLPPDIRKTCFAVKFKSHARCYQINDSITREKCLADTRKF